MAAAATREWGVGPPDAEARAHGRVNLMGDHTDYNGGYVLPICIPQSTHVRLWKRRDRQVRALSRNLEGSETAFSLDELVREHSWADYVKGVLSSLLRAGFSLSGFDMTVASTVPLGSGLSSSAALEVSLLRALRLAFGLSLTDERIAVLARAAETDFVGAPVGIMDQMASSVGNLHSALYLDTRTLAFRSVRIPDATELLVIDTCIAHAHATGEYAVRRAECAQAAQLLQVEHLTDLTWPTHASDIGGLPPPLNRRTRHVLTENARVQMLVAAFLRDDRQACRSLFHESHASLRDDFAVSVPELDALVNAAAEDGDLFGARLTGGGFGGCIVALAREGEGRRAALRCIDRAGLSRDPGPVVVLPGT
jgi:galactokinase